MATATVVTKECRECGKEMKLAIPEGVKEGSLGDRFARGMSLLCDECAVIVERREEQGKLDERVELLVTNCGIPDEYRGFTWEEMEDGERRKPAIDAAKAWAAGTINGLLIGGPVGTGKSRLAATAAWDRLGRAKPLRWVSVARLVTMDKAGFGTDEKKQATKLLTGKAPLVLDDLDKVPVTESVKSILFLAIDNRVTAGVPLLVTTNLPKDQFEGEFGSAIASRLLGYCTTASLVGRDRRQD